MNKQHTASSLAPWSGLIAGPVLWALHHQLGSDAAYWHCTQDARWIGIGIGAVCIAGAAAATWISYASTRPIANPPQPQETRRFTAWISAAGGALFTFALILQTIASGLAPTCAP